MGPGAEAASTPCGSKGGHKKVGGMVPHRVMERGGGAGCRVCVVCVGKGVSKSRYAVVGSMSQAHHIHACVGHMS